MFFKFDKILRYVENFHFIFHFNLQNSTMGWFFRIHSYLGFLLHHIHCYLFKHILESIWYEMNIQNQIYIYEKYFEISFRSDFGLCTDWFMILKPSVPVMNSALSQYLGRKRRQSLHLLMKILQGPLNRLVNYTTLILFLNYGNSHFISELKFFQYLYLFI